jgi:hypothetical protein
VSGVRFTKLPPSHRARAAAVVSDFACERTRASVPIGSPSPDCVYDMLYKLRAVTQTKLACVQRHTPACTHTHK